MTAVRPVVLAELPVPVEGPLPGAQPGAVRAPDPREAALPSAPSTTVGGLGGGGPSQKDPLSSAGL